MKKYIAMLSAIAMISALAGCAKTTDENSDENEYPSIATAAEATVDPQSYTAGSPEATQPDPQAPPAAEGEDGGDNAVSDDTEDQTGQPDPEGNGSFDYDDNGAVVFDDGDSSGQDDATLIAAAQALYESACQTEWTYSVGTPYQYDTEDHIENEYGWEFYHVTSEGVESLADVERDYYTVFSDKYPNHISDLYMESDGKLYVVVAERGMDLYYSASKVKRVVSRTDDEIVFEVENFYTGTDIDGSASYSRVDEFSVVVEDDGTWKAGRFVMPY